MAILDRQGRLFGKVSILDIGAGLIILLAIAGIFLLPGSSGSVAQLGTSTKPVEVDVIVRGLTVENPEALMASMREEGKTNVIIRNQPYGEVTIKEVKPLPRSTAVPQPDGSVKSFPDPRPELDFTTDMMITLTDDAQITDGGPVFGNTKMKIGTSVELEGLIYRFNTAVIDVRIIE